MFEFKEGLFLNKKILFAGQVLFSLLALYLLFSLINFSKIAGLVSSINLFFIPLIFLLFVLNILFFVISYWFLLGRKLPFRETTVDYFVAWAFGLFLPGKIGELAIIPVLKKKYGVPYKFAVIATVSSKAATFLVFCAVALLFYFNPILLSSLILVLLGVSFGLFLFRKRSLLFLKKLSKTNHIVRDFYENKTGLKKLFSPQNIFVLFFLAFLRFLTFAGISYFGFLAFNFEINLVSLSIAVALSQVVAFIPISLNGIGVRETTFAAFLATQGVAYELSAGVAFLSLVISYLLVITIFCLWNIFLTKKLISKGKK